MSYEVRLAEVLLPITPSKIDISINGNNKTINLINEGEINILKQSGLKTISFEFLIPANKYSFAVYDSFFRSTEYYLERLSTFKDIFQPIRFTIIRRFNNGKIIFNTDMDVAIESYSIINDYQDGLDTRININLKEFKKIRTKELNETEKGLYVTNKRDQKSIENNRTHTVVKNDTLYGIAKTYYGDGSLYKNIAESNNITNPNFLKIGQVISIP